jgi:hypothetical protein
MNERADTASTPRDTTTADTTAQYSARIASMTATPLRPTPVAATSTGSYPSEAGPPAPALRDFLGGEETRLRDLLAFALAAEAGSAPTPATVEALRHKAEADLHAHAFRLLHNQIETIRHQAVQEHFTRVSRGLSFSRVLTANLVAFAIVAVLALAATSGEPSVLDRLRDGFAPLLARFLTGS